MTAFTRLERFDLHFVSCRVKSLPAVRNSFTAHLKPVEPVEKRWRQRRPLRYAKRATPGSLLASLRFCPNRRVLCPPVLAKESRHVDPCRQAGSNQSFLRRLIASRFRADRRV